MLSARCRGVRAVFPRNLIFLGPHGGNYVIANGWISIMASRFFLYASAIKYTQRVKDPLV